MTRRRPRPRAPVSRGIARASGVAGVCLAASLAFAGCADLQSITPDVCGNRIVEPGAGEDCDGEPGCGEPGSLHACRYLCALGTSQTCPTGSGYGCGVDGVCRQHLEGAFEPMQTIGTVSTRDLTVADLDANGCNELVRTTVQGVSVTSFASHAPGFCATAEQVLPAEAPAEIYPAPLLSDLSGDGRPELVVPGPGLLASGLFVDTPGADGTLGPVLYTSAELSMRSVLQVKVGVRGQDALLLFLSPASGSGVSVAAVLDPSRPPELLTGDLGGDLAGIAALTAGDIDGPPVPASDCDAVVVARAGGTSLQIDRICGPGGSLAFTALADVALEAGVTLRSQNAAVAVFDYDGDGNPDLVANASDGNLHIAYGLGDGTFNSTPPPVAGSPDQRTSPLPVTGMLADPGYIFVAGHFQTGSGPSLVPVACPAAMTFLSSECRSISGPCEAVVVDIDRDGLDNIVAMQAIQGQAQEPGLLVYRSDGAGGFYLSTLGTQCPPHHLVAGDFDDDGVMDVAFLDQIVTTEEQPVTALRVAYGNAFAPPSQPGGEGQLPSAVGLAAGRFESAAPGYQIFASRQLSDAMATTSGLALAEGHSGRQMLAPFYFPAGSGAQENLVDVSLVSSAAGLFGTDPTGAPQPGLAVVTSAASGPSGSQVLWLLDASAGAADLQALTSNVTLPTCNYCVLTQLPTGSGEHDRLLLLGPEAVVYTVSGAGFAELARFATGHDFSAVDDPSQPTTAYPQRPLLADLDGDGNIDVVARATSGALVVLWGAGGTSFEAAELVPAPSCTTGDSCNLQAIALLGVEADGSREIAVFAAPGLELFKLPLGARTLEPVAASLPGFAVVTMPDYVALGAADFDGDGVTDLAVMASASLVTVLRGVPVRE